MEKFSKALILCLVSITCLVSCTNIKLQQLKLAYAMGNNERVEKLWNDLWNKRGEMSSKQAYDFVRITSDKDPEHYNIMRQIINDPDEDFGLRQKVYFNEQRRAQENKNQVNQSQNTNQGSGASNFQNHILLIGNGFLTKKVPEKSNH